LSDFYWIDGKAQSRKGVNDDCVMSLAIANLLLRKQTGGKSFSIDLGGHPVHRTLVAT